MNNNEIIDNNRYSNILDIFEFKKINPDWNFALKDGKIIAYILSISSYLEGDIQMQINNIQNLYKETKPLVKKTPYGYFANIIRNFNDGIHMSHGLGWYSSKKDAINSIKQIDYILFLDMCTRKYNIR